ncbi:MAG: hypothetical protein MJY63_05860 [Paludibacteraceae bacterium]|nr:hypothetical protein [Paludibacteraceae bacterium]
MKIQHFILSVVATLGIASCTDVPADYYTNVNDIFNNVVRETNKLDAKVQSNDTTEVAGMVENFKIVKKTLVAIGPFREDSSLINSVVGYVDLYSDNFMNNAYGRYSELATADSLSEEQSIELEMIKSTFATNAQTSLINAMNAHKDFQVKYELMNGPMVAE